MAAAEGNYAKQFLWLSSKLDHFFGSNAMFHVYILFSPSLDRHYIGQTGDVPRRVNFHAAHSTPFTAQANDWRLVFLEPVNTRQEAIALERRIKCAKNRAAIARFVRDPRNTIHQPIPISDW